MKKIIYILVLSLIGLKSFSQDHVPVLDTGICNESQSIWLADKAIGSIKLPVHE